MVRTLALAVDQPEEHAPETGDILVADFRTVVPAVNEGHDDRTLVVLARDAFQLIEDFIALKHVLDMSVVAELDHAEREDIPVVRLELLDGMLPEDFLGALVRSGDVGSLLQRVDGDGRQPGAADVAILRMRRTTGDEKQDNCAGMTHDLLLRGWMEFYRAQTLPGAHSAAFARNAVALAVSPFASESAAYIISVSARRGSGSV